MKKTVEVFWRFLLLGLMSFGGPAAHIGYFHRQFVEKLQWLDEEAYGRLIALSQFLPGPGSSQVGFAVGYRYAGLSGGIAAFVGFTSPSFLLLYGLSMSALANTSSPYVSGVIDGLKLFAVVVVADAVVTMFKSFCKDTFAKSICGVTTLALLLVASLWVQIAALIIAAVIGMLIGKPNQPTKLSKPTIVGIKGWPLVLFALLFIGLPAILLTLPELGSQVELNLFNQFYQAGSLVFGGGHVVLPLLQQILGEAISTDQFLTGYAAAQAMPGPMFSLAAFLGAEIIPQQPFWGALLATLAIFLPGFLLLVAVQQSWEALATNTKVAGAAWAINAAVVGLLLAAFFQPVFVSAVETLFDLVIVLIGFAALRIMKLPIVLLVISFGLLGAVMSGLAA